MRHIPHVYLPPPWQGQHIELGGQVTHHLRRVLRLSDGAPVSYTDGQGRRGEGTLQGEAVLRGDETYDAPSIAKLTVAVAPPRSVDRVRFLVEKLAELGVDRLIWLKTEHTVGRPPRIDKAEAWAREALEQSRGTWMMHIDASVARIDDLDGTILVADPAGRPATRIGADTTLVVGPEGGLGPDERPGTPVSLGDRILRVETAAIVGAALLKEPHGEG